MKIGQLKTTEPIYKAENEVKEWLYRLGVNGLSINTAYDARTNISLVRFNYKGKNYEFISRKQKNSRLNMFGIAKAMEYKVRLHLMEIEDFGTAMKGYLQIEGTIGTGESVPHDALPYQLIGISPTSSNDELEAHYKRLLKLTHPDRMVNPEDKEFANKRLVEINESWMKIKTERGI